MSFRNSFHFSVLAAVAIGVFLFRLWQPESQIQKHSAHLLNAISGKDWTRFGQFIADSYSDQWGNNRELVMQRSREIFRTVRGLRISAIGSTVRVENDAAFGEPIFRSTQTTAVNWQRN